MKTKYLPSLSSAGWISDPDVIANHLFATFFLTDYSQTALYTGHVSSFAYCMHLYNPSDQDRTKLTSMIDKVLTVYYLRYFDDVTVETSLTQDSEDFSKLELNIFLEYVDGDKRNTLYKAIQVVDGKARSVIDINNG